jgi:hypothetical protein
MKTRIFIMISAMALFSFSSCNKQASVDQTSLNLADDEAVTSAVFDDVSGTEDVADAILDSYQAGKSTITEALSDSCPAVTIDHPTDAVWPKTITVNYGAGCTGFYDQTRSGKIIIVVTGPRKAQGSKKTVTFDNFFFNGIKVEGTRVIENLGLNANQDMVFSVKQTGGKLTLPNGKTIEREVDHQREWIAGLNTKNSWDDEVLITGTASGVNVNSVAYADTITTALHWKRACKFIVSGVVKISRVGKDPVELNFGTGDCDAIATVTVNGESKDITLRYRHRLQN